jgi:di/tricarboxylate transporter
MITKVSYSIPFLIGLALIFLGARLILYPGVGEPGYGIQFHAQSDNSFHSITGIRDVFTGFLICMFVLINERRALGVTLLTGIMLPITDVFIVLSKSYNGFQQVIPHFIAIVICGVFGIILLLTKSKKKCFMKIEVLQSN